jgi:hypothetical protein
LNPLQFNDADDIHSPRVWATEELAWFFPMVDAVGKARQPFEALAPGGCAFGNLSFQVRAIRAYNTILGRLRTIGDPHAGVLACAFAERSWPKELVRPFGRLTGVMVRLAAAEDAALPDDDDARAVVEVRTATDLARHVGWRRPAHLRRLKRAAAWRFDRAFTAYLRARGGLSSILLALE